MTGKKKLSDEDMARVADYLSSPVHQVEREAFKPWRLIMVLTAAITVLMGACVLYAWKLGILIL
jgi:hypothetical protein